MKLNPLRAAVAAVLSVAAGSAYAVSPTFTPPGDGTALAADVSGATSTDPVLLAGMIATDANALCDTSGGTPDVYTTENRLVLGDLVANYAVVCQLKSSVGGGAGGNVAMMRKYSGGSGSGITAVAQGTAVANDAGNDREWVEPNSAGCTGSASIAAAGNLNAYNLFTGCSPTSASQVTQAGISDEEPALLGTSPTVISQLVTQAGVAVDFAPAVSNTLYTALQSAEHITANAANTDIADQPGLSSAQIRGILKGSITSGTFLYANPSGDTGTATAVGGGSIYICRRGASSGTQTGFQVHFLHQGCGTAGVGDPSLAFVGATTTSCTASGCGWNASTYGTDRVFAGTGSADVIACLNYHTSVGHLALGVLTTEYVPNDANAAAFRFIKVDGNAPSLENIVMGSYDFFTEDAWNTPNGTGNGGGTAPTPQQTGIDTALYAALKSLPELQAALTVQGTAGSPWYGGALGIPTGPTSTGVPVGYNGMHAVVAATPVNSSTTAAAYGGTPNNCNPPWNGARTLAPVDTSNL